MGKDRINDQNKCYEAPQAEIIVLGEECGLCSGSPCDGGIEDIGYIDWK